MKKIIYGLTALLAVQAAHAQNGLYTSVYLKGPMYAAATTMGAASHAVVAAGGNWYMGGSITSTLKGNNNSPNYTGYGEVDFVNSGTYSNAATTAGATGNIIDGYAGATSTPGTFILPIGANGVAYPLTVPNVGNNVAAYFSGSGSTQNKAVGGNTGNPTTEYSPYYDMPAGLQAGQYTFSYPNGFTPSPYSGLAHSNNTSVTGTSNSTQYSFLANVSTFSSTASTTTATLSSAVNSGVGTQVYFTTSTFVLPVTLTSFTGIANGCTADLAWSTSSESNSSYYGVETASDGINFAQVAKVGSKNSITGAVYNYSYALGAGTTYFRLRMVDNDGKYAYSQTVQVTGSGACSAGGFMVKVSPNPTSNVLNIQGLTSGSRLLLLNASGQKLAEATTSNSGYTMYLNGYANGVYLLQVQKADGTTSTTKVIKQ